MSISEQVKELRYNADIYNTVGSAWELNRAEAKKLQAMLREASDTIESLSAKLQAANMGRSEEEEKVWRYCKECKHYTPLPNGVRGGKRGHCEKRYPRDSRRGCVRACKMFSEKDSVNEP